jgi:uncharacterized membrane protein (DUF106 family)
MSFVNSLFNAIFDGFFAVTSFIGGEWALWIFSALAGIVFLFIFKWTSDQKAIKRVKDRIAAGFLAVRLFKDDFKQVWRANGSIFLNAFSYMGNALRPVAFMIIPVLFMLVQLNVWYGNQPLKPDLEYRVLTPLMEETGMNMTGQLVGNTSTMVTAKLSKNADVTTAEISLSTPDGLQVVTPAVRIAETNEVSWRLQALAVGEHEITLNVDGQQLTHTVFVGEEGKFRKIPAVTTRGAWNEFWNPTNAPISSEVPVEEFKVVYEEASFNLLGFKTHWVIAFFILSLVFGFALKGFFGVEI